jgi:Tfp pilus assembly protein PilZ
VIERRAHERHRVFRLGVKVATRDAFRASYLRDLSEGGLFVRSQHPLAIGSAVAIELAPPGHPPLSLSGKVVRHEDGGFGVQFGALEPDVKAALDALVAEYHGETAPAASDETALRAEIADLKGSIEAYEEELVRLRESETGLTEKLEAADAERQLLEGLVSQLQDKAEELEYERAKMTALLSEAAAEVAKLQADVVAADQSKDMKRQLDAANKQRAALMTELKAMQAKLQDSAFTKLRAEMREMASQLDDEKMKSMALQKALERFAAMGGLKLK